MIEAILRENDVCPVYCRKCGLHLVVEKKWLQDIRFDEIKGGVQLDNRIMVTCPRRLKFFGFFYTAHDRRQFTEDCKTEFAEVQIK